jgi:uncharacterized protein (DUF736 family)
MRLTSAAPRDRHGPRWPDLAGGDAAAPPAVLAQRRRARFLPLAVKPPFLARQETAPAPSCAPLRALRAAHPAASGLAIAIEAAMGAAETQGRRLNMATIGTFTQQANGVISGAIKTLTLNVGAAQFRPAEKDNERAPDYRVFVGQVEFGAAWKKTSRENRDYLSVKLDDPSFPAPIYASLVDADDGYSLIWSRSRVAD